ncbi:MAG: vgb, partial [Planctomycetaceae bacterium]|nr:vgb [Planctomycetaceae bacterium]
MAIVRACCLNLVIAIFALGWLPPRVNAADMQYPLDIAVDAQGTIYVADRNLPGIWQIKDGKRELYFEGSKKFRTPLNAVRCLIVDGKGQLLA